MDPLRNAKRRASARSPYSRRGLCQTSLSSPRSGGSRSSNDKGFFRFYIATSCGRIVAKPTVDSINTNAKCIFAGFTRVTGTEINEDRIEVYKVSASSYKRGGFKLMVGSGSG